MEEITVKVYRKQLGDKWINTASYSDIKKAFYAYSDALIKELIEKHARNLNLDFDGEILSSDNTDIDEFASRIFQLIVQITNDLSVTVKIEKYIIP